MTKNNKTVILKDAIKKLEQKKLLYQEKLKEKEEVLIYFNELLATVEKEEK